MTIHSENMHRQKNIKKKIDKISKPPKKLNNMPPMDTTKHKHAKWIKKSLDNIIWKRQSEIIPYTKDPDRVPYAQFINSDCVRLFGHLYGNRPYVFFDFDKIHYTYDIESHKKFFNELLDIFHHQTIGDGSCVYYNRNGGESPRMVCCHGRYECTHIVIENKPEHKEILEELVWAYHNKFFQDPNIVTKNTFQMVIDSGNGFDMLDLTCCPKEIPDDRYDLFYGDRFMESFDQIKSFFTEDITSGNLMLLHGDPGTGKSNLIKNLINISKSNVVYIPPNMASVLSNPAFFKFLTNHENKILLIEDAEEILTAARNSATNNILGMTDGFMKDALNMKIICTFNTDEKNIDSALLRKGRLHTQYKFGNLSKDEANKLAKFMQIDHEFIGSASLAEIFNYDHDNKKETKEERRAIGFF